MPQDGTNADEPQTADGPSVGTAEWTFDPDVGERASTALLTAFGELTGRDPGAMERPLYDRVEVDALDALFSDPGSEGIEEVLFAFDSYQVAIHADGTVSIVED
jgi:hypothetical protein